MAEARSAVSYSVEKANLLLQITEEEIVLRINKNALPSSVSKLKRTAFRRAYRARNALINAFYPAPPLQWGLLVSAPAAIMLSFPSSSSSSSSSAASDAEELSIMLRLLQPISDQLWGLDRYVPDTVSNSIANLIDSSSPATKTIAKAAVISASVGTGFILCVSYLRRFLLSALLSYQGWIYDEPKVQNIKTNIWGFLVKIISGQHAFRLTYQDPLLYSQQASLPHLPVPSLDSTCQKYLLSVRPLLDDEEFHKREEQVRSFKKNEGKKFQLYLKLRSWMSENYVAEWWEKFVYLRGRSPIVINSNYYILDSGLPHPPTSVQVARAASIISICLDFKYKLDRELIPPMMIRGTVPMCMSQYERMFATTRIPGKEIDTLEHDDYDAASHIIVLRKGNFYALNVYDENGVPLTPPEIETQLKWIVNDAEKNKPTTAEASIPALTTENRTTWATARQEFFGNGLNKQSLSAIEKALFVVSLDHETPGEGSFNDMARSLFHGSGTNRWCDKSFNFVVFPNGKAGLHVEHSWADAPVCSHMWEYVVILGINPDLFDERGYNKRTGPVPAHPPPSRLTWDLSLKAEKVIETAVSNVDKMISDIHLHLVSYQPYGKGFIKKCGVSPDAFVQMAMQIAYKRDAGQFGLTYESSMTRLFRLGRTETVRPVSIASANFVNAFEDPNVSKKAKIALLKIAADSHQQYYRDCMTGKGIDRHLFALYVVSQGMGVDSQFLKSALGMEWKLSTSQQPQGQTVFWNPNKSKEEAAKASPGGGFGPVSDSGYGVSYMIVGEDHLTFHISSKRQTASTDSAKFGERIWKALDEMKELFS